VPCEGECSGPRPICDLATDTCVQCTSNTHCDDDLPVCDTSSNTCVECTDEQANACDGATSVCNPDTHACVECLENEGCTEPSASFCNEDNECAPCTSNADCAHISDQSVCDNGECVECTAADETACGQHSCDPATNRCTKARRGTLGTCMRCLADSECIGGEQSDPEQRCVPMHFQGDIRPGGFCLRPVSKGCVRPYTRRLGRPSLSGADTDDYCGIPESITSCEAVRDMIGSVAYGADSDCGCRRDWAGNCLDVGEARACREIGVSGDECTYQCGILVDCPTGFVCKGNLITYCEREISSSSGG
jgi:hypothetical protein